MCMLNRPARLPGVGLADNSPTEVFASIALCLISIFISIHHHLIKPVAQRPHRNKVLGRALTVQRQSGCLLGCVIHLRLVYGGLHSLRLAILQHGATGDYRGATGELLRYLATIVATKISMHSCRYKGPSRLKPPNRLPNEPRPFRLQVIWTAQAPASLRSFSATLPLCHRYFLLTRTPFLCTYTAPSWLFWSN